MLNKVLDVIEKYVTAILFAAMCTIIMIQVIFRATGGSLAWTEELERYFFVWIIYLACGRAMATEKHLTVDILPLLLKGKTKVILHIISTVLTLLFCACLLYAGSIVLSNLMVRTQFSPANHINMIYLYAAPTFGTLLMALRCIGTIINSIKKLNDPDADAHVLEEVTE